MKINVIISCEHGGNEIPSCLKSILCISQKTLDSHRGYDKGALNLAKELSQKLNLIPITNIFSRLVIDYNRSLDNPQIWSRYSDSLEANMKRKLINDYLKYRESVESKIRGITYHFSMHSFTPVLKGAKRNCDFAILYDPSSKREKEFAKNLKSVLLKKGIRCRLNYPYHGRSDGLTKSLRLKYGKDYSGLEFEFNQNIVHNKSKTALILLGIMEVLDKLS